MAKVNSKKVKAEDIVDLQDNAVSRMNSELKEVFDSVAQSLEEMRVDNLRFYYRLGALCGEVKNNKEKYGNDGFKLLKNSLYIHSNTITQAVKFYNTFTIQELEEVIELSNRAATFKITWSHISKLLRMEDKQQRKELIQRAIHGLWDPKKLAEEVKKICGGRRAGGGRPMSVPRGLSAQIRQIKAECERWVKKEEQVWNGDETNIFMNIQNGEGGVYTEEQLEDLVKVREFMATISTRAGADAERCESLLRHVRACLAAQAASTRDEEDADEYQQVVGTTGRSLELDDCDFTEAAATAAAAGIDEEE